MKLLFLLLFVTLAQAFREDWIDPHEIKINNNAKRKIKKPMSKNDGEEVLNQMPGLKENRVDTSSVEENTSLMFLKRTVNLILNSASADKNDPSLYTGSYQFKIDTEEYKFLIDFINKESVTTDDIRRLDTILDVVFVKHYTSFINISKDYLFAALLDIKTLLIFGGTVCLLIMYYLFKNNNGFFYIFSYFMFLMLVVDYAVRYKFLYEEAEEHNFKLFYSEECDTSKMNWKDFIQFVISPRDCERKIVTPLDVSLNQLKYIIIIPLESFGTGMGKFGNQLWTELPSPWNILIFPIMLVFIILTMFFFIMGMKGASFRVNLLHLLNFDFGPKQSDDNNRIVGKTLDKLLEATTSHRPMIEVTRSSPEGKYQRRNKNKNSSPPKRVEKKANEQNREKTSPKDKKSKNSDEKNRIDEKLSKSDTTKVSNNETTSNVDGKKND